MSGNGDIKSGGSTLYPTMLESPELRWCFIRKVHSIITIQLFLGIAVAFIVVFVHPVANFFFNSKLGHVLCIVLIIVPFISTYSLLLYLHHNFSVIVFHNTLIYYLFHFAVLCPLYFYHNKHPLNYILLLIITVAIPFPIGLIWAFLSGT